MPTFSSKDQAMSVFRRLFEIMLEDEAFVSGMRDAGLTLRLVQTKPDLCLYVDPDAVQPENTTNEAAITVKMSCDTAHSLWLGRLSVPLAVATGRLRIRGSVARVLEFVPLLQPAFDRYPAIAAAAGLAA